MRADRNTVPRTDGARRTNDSTTADARRPSGRTTTYLRELYRLRHQKALRGLSAPAVDVLTHICHLADCYGRDAVFRQHQELADELDRSARRTQDAVSKLDGFLAAAGPTEGRDLVYVTPHAVAPGSGLRRATMFTLGPAFPDETHWRGR